MSSEQQQRQTLIELIKRSSPTGLERLHHLLVGMSESWEDDERWHRHRIWHRHEATLDLSEEEFQVALDFVIVRRVGQSNPEPTADELANHDRFANPD